MTKSQEKALEAFDEILSLLNTNQLGIAQFLIEQVRAALSSKEADQGKALGDGALVFIVRKIDDDSVHVFSDEARAKEFSDTCEVSVIFDCLVNNPKRYYEREQ